MSSVSKILVVDDEDTMRRTLADILRLEGYLVQTAANGQAAVAAVQEDSIDLVLLDLKMPGMDGLEVLREISRLSPETMVILLTAHGSLESAIEALRRQAYDYLLKPSTPAQILGSVQKALARRTADLERRELIEQIDTSLRRLKGVSRGEVLPDLHTAAVSLLGNGLMVDFSRRKIWLEATPEATVNLTPAESKLLNILIQNAGQVISHRELVQKVQGYEVAEWEAPEVMRPLVSRLRQKLSRFPGGKQLISNVRGSGYLFERRSRAD